jgi:hypothetical protein
MSTNRDVITRALRLINVLGQNAPADANALSNALQAEDAMVDSWSNERLMVYSIKPYIFYTQVNQQVYTMGPATDNPGTILEYQLPLVNAGSGYVDGYYPNVPLSYVTSGVGTGAIANITVNLGQIINCEVVNYGTGGYCGINYSYGDQLTTANTNLGGTGSGFIVTPSQVTSQTNWIVPRPMKIEKAYTIWQYPGQAQAVDIPIQLLTMEQYASIGVKQTTSTFPFGLYDDNNWPTRNITVFPVPQVSTGLRFWLREPLINATIESLDQPVDFPPGYERAFTYGLACELAPEYMKTIPEIVMQTANSSKLDLKRLNQAPRYKMGDGQLVGNRGNGRWNWVTGSYGWGPWI